MILLNPKPLVALAALASLAACSTPAHYDGPTAQDLYIGCRRFAEPPLASGAAGLNRWQTVERCAAVAGVVLTLESGRPGRRGAWCLPVSPEISVENYTPMVAAYLSYYERNARRIARTDGRAAFRNAMVERWPCPGP